MRAWVLSLLLVSVGFSVVFSGTAQAATSAEVSSWFKVQEPVSVRRMMAHISPSDAVAGTVIASPSRHSPPYYYHWIRDAAVTMNTVMNLLETGSAQDPARLRMMLEQFSELTQRQQAMPSEGGIGEPKYNIDGTPFTGEWGRPQLDGPALRAIVLARFAHWLLDRGETGYVEKLLFDPFKTSATVISTDLDYVANTWRRKNFDIWEETEGDHYYTRMVQRRALRDGAVLAQRMGDLSTSHWYLTQAAQIETEISKHWDEGKGLFVPTLNWVSGREGKVSGIDTSVFLAILHSDRRDGYVDYTAPMILKMFDLHVATFQRLYVVNKIPGAPGVAIGRYPEDAYDGASNVGGNPWPLLTAAFARFCYEASIKFVSENKPDQAGLYLAKGDEFMRRLKFHAPADGAFAEQINRDTGLSASAIDLTWSHVEILEAGWARERAQKAVSALKH